MTGLVTKCFSKDYITLSKMLHPLLMFQFSCSVTIHICICIFVYLRIPLPLYETNRKTLKEGAISEDEYRLLNEIRTTRNWEGRMQYCVRGNSHQPKINNWWNHNRGSDHSWSTTVIGSKEPKGKYIPLDLEGKCEALWYSSGY